MATRFSHSGSSEGPSGRLGVLSRPAAAPTATRSGTEYVHVNVGNQEETILETYFVMLSKFNFDRAREQCEREREAKSSTGGTNWCDFIMALSRLSGIEMSYFSLNFMKSSRFVRKEPLRVTYEQLIQELKKVHEVYYHRRGGTDFSWERKMTELVSHIMEFVAAKRDMSDFYIQFDQMEGCHLDYKRLEKYLRDIHERYKDSFQHTFLKPVKTTFMREVGVLSDLIRAQLRISEWQFLPAILSLQSSHGKLTLWNGVVPLGSQDSHPARQHNRISRGRVSSSPPPQARLPYLYKWICKLHVGLLSKFSLYFHGVLSEHSCVFDMKHLLARLETDYITRMFALIRQTPAICVCLVFNTNVVPDFKGPKYSFPDSPAPVLSGMNSYPIMFAAPFDFDFLHHRPNIVSTIIFQGEQLSKSSQFVSQYDETLRCTYYLAQVDPLVTLVVISVSRGREKDSKTMTLMSEIVNHLKNVTIAIQLRPGAS